MPDLLRQYDADVEDTEYWVSIKCPFHDDNRPSARYNGTGFICNGCGIKGDVISVIQQVEGISYADARSRAERLSENSSGSVPGRTTRKPRRRAFG